MHTWTNTAQAPSRLDERSDKALLYVMDDLGIPDCGLKMLRTGIDSDNPMPINMSSSNAVAGLWQFHPVMDMSFNKNGIDYTQTTVLADGVTARGKYIPINCDGQLTHVAYFPKCGNIATLVKKETEVVERSIIERDTDIIIKREFDVETCHSVPIPGTLVLILLGLVTLKLWRK